MSDYWPLVEQAVSLSLMVAVVLVCVSPEVLSFLSQSQMR